MSTRQHITYRSDHQLARANHLNAYDLQHVEDIHKRVAARQVLLRALTGGLRCSAATSSSCAS